MRPLIGIPQCLDDRGRWKRSRDYHYLDAAYARAIDAAGATPVYLPIQRDTTALIARIDGLLLPGGDDLLPERAYPEHVQFDAAADAQLAFDRQLLATALDRSTPILAICYGMQLLALQCGGALHYDIPTDLPSAEAHQLDERDGRHPVEIENGTRLAAILGDRTIAVNSLHHQAVADPGDLQVSARSADGLIEAVEAAGKNFVLGVQWHPEKIFDGNGGELFGAFTTACQESNS
jgi:putative glutamine amidotransferase